MLQKADSGVRNTLVQWFSNLVGYQSHTEYILVQTCNRMKAGVPLIHRISIGNHWLPLVGKGIESHTICGCWAQRPTFSQSQYGFHSSDTSVTFNNLGIKAINTSQCDCKWIFGHIYILSFPWSPTL